MNLARIKALSMMVCALYKVQRVTYTKLATAFDSNTASESSLRRLRWLFAQCEISTDIKDKEGKPELQNLFSYCNASESLEMYKLLRQVETFFKGMESSGFDNEGCNVREQSRMFNLFAIIMITYERCCLVGIYINESSKPKTVLKNGKRAVSLFNYGLDYIFQCLFYHTNRYRIDVFMFCHILSA